MCSISKFEEIENRLFCRLSESAGIAENERFCIRFVFAADFGFS